MCTSRPLPWVCVCSCRCALECAHAAVMYWANGRSPQRSVSVISVEQADSAFSLPFFPSPLPLPPPPTFSLPSGSNIPQIVPITRALHFILSRSPSLSVFLPLSSKSVSHSHSPHPQSSPSFYSLFSLSLSLSLSPLSHITPSLWGGELLNEILRWI